MRAVSTLTRSIIALLMLFTLAVSSAPVNAYQSHEMHASASEMSQDMAHEHVRDCAAACGAIERSESRKLIVNQRKKEKEVEPEQDPYPLNTRNYQYPSYKFRTVFIQPQNNTYLRHALLRL